MGTPDVATDGALTGADQIRAVVASVAGGDMTKAQAVVAVSAADLDAVIHTQFDAGDHAALAHGLGASPGAAVGRAYFDADAAADAYDRGEDVILVMQETSPEDVHGMEIAEGILTTRGGLASHAAVVARGWGKPAVCGVEAIDLRDGAFSVGDVTVNAGDVISLDGAAGEVYLGAASQADAEPCPEFDVLLGWADEIREGKVGVRANADTAADATKAREFGAEGIGLCRTEHQFLGDRLPAVQAMILATDAAAETRALEQLEELQIDDFTSLLEAMDGLPVTVRLLDPPLHEFLPDLDELLVAEATNSLADSDVEVLDVARQWREENPMLGTRGVRLGVLKDGLYRMQARAVAKAVQARLAAGGDPQVEIMVPLIVDARELELITAWIEEEIAVVGVERAAIAIGTMIETPRAALVAATIAPIADFFSFGTNDLTQMTFGFSRDDVESRIMSTYLERGLIDANPFETVDPHSVGKLVRDATAAARETNTKLKVGVCGEHGGDPASIELFVDAGLDYVSCSPYRIPIARLAAAQVVVTQQR